MQVTFKKDLIIGCHWASGGAEGGEDGGGEEEMRLNS